MFAATGFARLLSQPPDHGDALYRAGSGRRGQHRVDAQGSGDPLRRVGGRRHCVVPVGQAALARMTLAEKGLPHSGSVGNELYDKLGSLGLTSFMQQVTRVRAMEGELARTIQMMRGVKAARVHVVMGDEGSFRREPQAAVRLGDHPHRRPGRSHGRPSDPPSRGRRDPGHEDRRSDGAQRRRSVARQRPRFDREIPRQPARRWKRTSRRRSAKKSPRR